MVISALGNSLETAFNIVGGVGLFLLGMNLLTEGLKEFAGDSLRKVLLRFTSTPLKAFVSGATATMLVQSSSATTIAVIGFVSAGLLTFPQALGVVFGASLGTTGTSWVVAWIGLKIKMGLYALPLIGLGAMAKLLGPGRWKSAGISIAGFGLIFVGIDTLQIGMQGFASQVDLHSLPDRGLFAIVVALLIGLVMTVVMQSSSAAIATTLTALDAGAIKLEQAAAIVIGAAVGTTVTGALAAIGASNSAKRTALAHVLFNSVTGGIALVLFPWFLRLMNWAEDSFRFGDATALAAFHTAFIALGAIIFLPFVQVFAAFIERLVPDKGPRLIRHLDRSLRDTPAFALAATRVALRETAIETFKGLARGLRFNHWDAPYREVEEAIMQTQTYLESLPVTAQDRSLTASRLSQVHAIDHLHRLSSRLVPPARVRTVLAGRGMEEAVNLCRQTLDVGIAVLEGVSVENWQESLEQISESMTTIRYSQRPVLIEQAAIGDRGAADTLNSIDAYRWLDRVCHHVWRSCAYLAELSSDRGNTGAESTSPPQLTPSTDSHPPDLLPPAESKG